MTKNVRIWLKEARPGVRNPLVIPKAHEVSHDNEHVTVWKRNKTLFGVPLHNVLVIEATDTA